MQYVVRSRSDHCVSLHVSLDGRISGGPQNTLLLTTRPCPSSNFIHHTQCLPVSHHAWQSHWSSLFDVMLHGSAPSGDCAVIGRLLTRKLSFKLIMLPSSWSEKQSTSFSNPTDLCQAHDATPRSSGTGSAFAGIQSSRRGRSSAEKC